MEGMSVKTLAWSALGRAKPTLPAGKDFINTGTALITANPVPGIDSQTPEKAASACWGS